MSKVEFPKPPPWLDDYERSTRSHNVHPEARSDDPPRKCVQCGCKAHFLTVYCPAPDCECGKGAKK